MLKAQIKLFSILTHGKIFFIKTQQFSITALMDAIIECCL